MTLAFYEYRCPFSILRQFDQWWEWHERTIHRKKPTGRVITAMLSDVDEIKRHKIEPRLYFRVSHDYGLSTSLPRGLLVAATA